MRSTRSILIFTSGSFTTAFTMGLGLVATPFILEWLGEERFGAYRLCLDWLNNLLLLELGVGGAIGPLLASALANKDHEQVGSLLVEGLWVLTVTTLLILVCGAGLVFAIPELVPVAESLTWDLRIACALGLVGFALLPLSVFRRFVDARQRTHWINGLLAFQGLLSTALSLYAAWSGLGISGQVGALTIGALPLVLVTTVHGLRYRPGWLAKARRDDGLRKEARKKLLKLSWPMLGLGLCGRASFLLDQIVVGLILGPATVVVFFITQRLAHIAQGQVQGIGNASWAALAELYAQGKLTVFNSRIVELTRLSAVLGISVLVPIVAYNRPFVSLWVGEANYAGDHVTVVVGVNAFVHSIISLWTWVFTATKRVGSILGVWVVASILNLALSIALTKEIGLVGPLLGTMVAFFSTTLWYIPWRMRREFSTPLVGLWSAFLIPALLGGILAGCAWQIAEALQPQGWFALMFHMTATGGVVLLLAIRFVMTAQERDMWRQRLRMRLNRKLGRTAEQKSEE